MHRGLLGIINLESINKKDWYYIVFWVIAELVKELACVILKEIYLFS